MEKNLFATVILPFYSHRLAGSNRTGASSKSQELASINSYHFVTYAQCSHQNVSCHLLIPLGLGSIIMERGVQPAGEEWKVVIELEIAITITSLLFLK